MIEVLRTGPLATIQDLGRPGYAGYGVSPSGAADRAGHRLANRLVANPEGAATIEVTLGGLEIVPSRGVWIAVSGAPLPVVVGSAPAPGDPSGGGRAGGGRAGGEVGMNAPVYLPAGRRLALGRPEAGLRSYLAVRGGLDVPLVLGSRSTDTLAVLGPAPLAVGDRIAVLPPGPEQPNVDLAPVRSLPTDVRLRIEAGPRADWLRPEAFDLLTGADWSVSANSNRVGVRLEGPLLERAIEDELPPEGLVRGAVQVPPGGQPIIFLADHPVTGGYPVVAVVLGADLPGLAQARPGQRVHLCWGLRPLRCPILREEP